MNILLNGYHFNTKDILLISPIVINTYLLNLEKIPKNLTFTITLKGNIPISFVMDAHPFLHGCIFDYEKWAIVKEVYYDIRHSIIQFREGPEADSVNFSTSDEIAWRLEELEMGGEDEK